MFDDDHETALLLASAGSTVAVAEVDDPPTVKVIVVGLTDTDVTGWTTCTKAVELVTLDSLPAYTCVTTTV